MDIVLPVSEAPTPVSALRDMAEPRSFQEMIDRTYGLHLRPLMIQRHEKYGPHNISRFLLRGVTVRAHDKMERIIKAVMDNGRQDFADESLDDAMADIANYFGPIGLSIRAGWWTQHGCPAIDEAAPDRLPF